MAYECLAYARRPLEQGGQLSPPHKDLSNALCIGLPGVVSQNNSHRFFFSIPYCPTLLSAYFCDFVNCMPSKSIDPAIRNSVAAQFHLLQYFTEARLAHRTRHVRT